MLKCDFCGNIMVDTKDNFIESHDKKRHICHNCIKICSIIVKDEKTNDLTYINQYKEEVLQS